jgi:hypothetical protein
MGKEKEDERSFDKANKYKKSIRSHRFKRHIEE